MLATAHIEEVVIPAGLDDPAAADFLDMVRVRNTVEYFAIGTDVMAPTAAELLPVYTSAFEPKSLFLAKVDGSAVGRAVLELPIGGDSRSAWLSTEVLPDFRGNGLGTQLFDHIEAMALDAGRTVLQAQAMHTATEGGERLPSPTGFGDLPMEDPGVRFLLRRGYQLEQVERMSLLPLPVDRAALQRIVDDGAARVAPEYRLVAWSGRTPAERVEDLLMLHTRMSIDAPFAGLDIEEEPWTAARLDEYETSFETSERRGLTAAVEHVASGSLVGFSVLVVPDDRSRPAQQDDTLVTIGHRGHGLGMLMKAANLLALADLTPPPPSVVTGNAEENRHMLDINEALGFRSAGRYGCWRKA